MTVKYFTVYLAALVTFLIVDGVWLGVVARSFYVQQLGHLLRPAPNFGVAGMFYVLYVVGVVVFAVLPALAQQSWLTAVLLGALLGFIAYGTYDLTNLATLANWPVLVSVVDMIWGTVLTATVAFAGYSAARIMFVGSNP
ncbi:MAG: DUF2177 family protein [Alphaproteobacteria bacterium]|jgi:uncharacterized membrane protein|nr:DUF2177 family protein [Alphaproteobacteria bacterium]